MHRRPGVTTAIRHNSPNLPPGSTGAKRGTGLWYLYPAVKTPGHIPDPATAHGLTNPGIHGMLWRIIWGIVQPSIFSPYNWDYLDAAFAATYAVNKLTAIQLLGGQYAPDDFFTQPGALYITLTSVNPDGSVKTTVPWDPQVWNLWGDLNVALAARYGNDSRFHHIVMACVGQASESFLALSPDEIAQARALAQDMGYSDEKEAWSEGTKALIDIYDGVWSKPFCLVTGPPYGRNTVEILQQAFDYGDGNYRRKFSARSHDWNSQGPIAGQISYDEIKLLAPHSDGTGGQAGNSQDTLVKYRTMLQNAFDAGCNYFEPFSNNVDNTTYQATTEEFNSKFLSR